MPARHRRGSGDREFGTLGRPCGFCQPRRGRPFDQAAAQRLAQCERLLLICGHYEGFDERIIDILQPEELSLGDFVLSGGEPAALAIIDAIVRLLPGALGNEAGAADESFQDSRLGIPAVHTSA